MSAQRLEVSLFGVGTVLRLERDAWPMANNKGKQQMSTAPDYGPTRSVAFYDLAASPLELHFARKFQAVGIRV